MSFRVLITGGAGFIGSHMTIHLLKHGCTVLNVDKLTYAGSLDNLGDHASHPAHEFVREDICDQAQMGKLCARFRPDAIVHMAAETHVDRSLDDPARFDITNILGTKSMLQAALAYWQDRGRPGGFRFLHLSTDEVFGALGETGTFDENSPYNPTSPYAVSKAEADLLVRDVIAQHAFPALIVHASNNYGPHQYPEKLIPLMTLTALEQNPLPVYGDGRQVRSWIYVRDQVDALWRCLQRGRPGQSYCMGGDTEIRNLDMVRTLCTLLDRHQPRMDGASYQDLIAFVGDRPGHDFRYAMDCRKAERELGWAPHTPLAQGLEATLGWYLSHRDRLSVLPARHRQGIRT